MSLSVMVNLSGEDPACAVHRLTIGDGRHFLTLALGPDARIILPGMGMAAAHAARTIAEALIAAADAMPADPQAVAEQAS